MTEERADRRRHGRFVATCRAQAPVTGGSVVANVKNLSYGGMLLADASGLRAGDATVFQIRLPDDDRPLAVRGTVRRLSTDGVHVEFAPGQPEVEERLRGLVETVVVPELELQLGDTEAVDPATLVALAQWYHELGRSEQALDLLRTARETEARGLPFVERMAQDLEQLLEQSTATGPASAAAPTPTSSTPVDMERSRVLERKIKKRRRELYAGFVVLQREQRQLDALRPPDPRLDPHLDRLLAAVRLALEVRQGGRRRWSPAVAIALGAGILVGLVLGLWLGVGASAWLSR